MRMGIYFYIVHTMTALVYLRLRDLQKRVMTTIVIGIIVGKTKDPIAIFTNNLQSAIRDYLE
jgi:hypothetical protein